jgi:hypothetical protein
MKLKKAITLLGSLAVTMLALPAQALLIDFTENEWSAAHGKGQHSRDYVIDGDTYYVKLKVGFLTGIASTQSYDGGTNSEYCQNSGPLACEIDGIGVKHILDTNRTEIDRFEYLTVSFWDSSWNPVTTNVDAIHLLDLYDEDRDDKARVTLWNGTSPTVLPVVSGNGNTQNGGFYTMDENNSSLSMLANAVTFSGVGRVGHVRDFALAGLLVTGGGFGTTSIDVPEPETMGMFAMALLIAGGLKRKRH